MTARFPGACSTFLGIHSKYASRDHVPNTTCGRSVTSYPWSVVVKDMSSDVSDNGMSKQSRHIQKDDIRCSRFDFVCFISSVDFYCLIDYFMVPKQTQASQQIESSLCITRTRTGSLDIYVPASKPVKWAPTLGGIARFKVLHPLIYIHNSRAVSVGNPRAGLLQQVVFNCGLYSNGYNLCRPYMFF